MPLSTEEVADLQAKLQAGTLTPTDPLLAPLSTMGLIVRTPTQEEEFKTNHKRDVISKHDGDAYKVVTDSFKEISGVAPNANEKATDYVKRVFETVKSERDDLQTKVKNGTGTDADKAQITKLEQQIVQLKETHATETKTLQTRLTTYQQTTAKETAFAEIKGNLKKSLDAAILPDVVQARMDRFDREFEVVVDDNGKQTVKYRTGENAGQPVKDSSFKELSVKDVLANNVFQDLIESKPTQPGSGATPPGQPGNPPANPVDGIKPTKESYQRPATVVNRVQLHKDLMEKGLTVNDDAYLDIMDANGSLPLGSDE